METWAVTNEEQVRYWNGDEAVHWLVHEQRYERMLAPFTDHLLTSAAIAGADLVVDLGCGTGSTTRVAGRAAIQGEALGVDLSAALLGQAATFANIARGLRPWGRLVLACWQNLADNEWILVPGAAAAQHLALPPLDDPTAPGPFSLGERDRIATVLRAAALSDVAIEPIAEPLWMGPDVVDTIAFLTSTGIWNSLLRDADPPTVARVSEAVQAALEPYLTPDGLLGSRAWLVTASRPWR